MTTKAKNTKTRRKHPRFDDPLNEAYPEQTGQLQEDKRGPAEEGAPVDNRPDITEKKSPR